LRRRPRGGNQVVVVTPDGFESNRLHPFTASLPPGAGAGAGRSPSDSPSEFYLERSGPRARHVPRDEQLRRVRRKLKSRTPLDKEPYPHKAVRYAGGVMLSGMPSPHYQGRLRGRGGPRGRVQTFSRKSRLRMLRLVAKVRRDYLGSPFMVTLTYPDEWPGEPGAAYENLRVFLQRLRRRGVIGPCIWRLELQKRGAPHFHLVVWPVPGRDLPTVPLLRARLASWWKRTIGTEHPWSFTYGVAVTDGKNVSAAYRYLAKYVAKEDEGNEATYEGRRWGRSRDLPLQPMHEVRYNHFENLETRRMVRRWLKHRGPAARRYAGVVARGAPAFIFIEQHEYVALFRGAWIVSADKYGRAPPGRPRAAPAAVLRQRRERARELMRQRKHRWCVPVTALPKQLELSFD